MIWDKRVWHDVTSRMGTKQGLAVGRFLLASLQPSFFPGLWVKGDRKSDLLGFITILQGRGSTLNDIRWGEGCWFL